jgi:uncharacterized protein (DUF427 family)
MCSDARIRLGLSAPAPRAQRVLETSHRPVYDVPLADVVPGALEPAGGCALGQGR